MPKAKRKALQRASSAYRANAAKAGPTVNDRMRIVTHSTLAPVARDMGYTVTGLMSLCRNVTDSWVKIGTTRINGEDVFAMRPTFRREQDEFGRVEIVGMLQFSVGNAGLGFTPAAMALRANREAIADRIVANLRADRGNDVNPVRAMAVIANGRDSVAKGIVSESLQGPQVTVIPHLGPRGPEQ